MRPALALLVILLAAAPALAGCATVTESEIFLEGPHFSAGFGTPPPPRTVEAPDARSSDLEDALAPPVFHDGVAATAVAIGVAEREADRSGPPGATTKRHPCGGAILAIAEGAPDPRKLLQRAAGTDDLPPVTYEASRMVTDGWGREWTTDAYTATQETTGRSWRIWVANVDGGLAFRPDDGFRHCEPHVYGGNPFNVIVHTWGHEDGTDLYYAPLDRFPAPPERAWVLGPID